MENIAQISVIIGSYNGDDFLGETIDSILAQTYGNIELILVDDGSKDNTLNIMHQYENKDSRVHVIHQKNSGASAARETGYRASTGDYVILADDDDVWSPYLLEDLITLSGRFANADVIATFNRHLSDFSAISAYDWTKNMTNDKLGTAQIMSGHEFSLISVPTGDVRPCTFWGMFFKKTFLDKMVSEFIKLKDALPTHYFNDTFCVCKVCEMANKIVITNQVHILYRVCPSSLSHKSTVSIHVKHYIYASQQAMLCYKALGWRDTYERILPGWYLMLLRSWFMVYAHEKDEEGTKRYFAEIRRLYDQYMGDLRGIQRKSLKDSAIYYCIILWNKHPELWFRLVRILRGW